LVIIPFASTHCTKTTAIIDNLTKNQLLLTHQYLQPDLMTFVHENVNTDEKATAESKANFFIEIIPPKIKLQKYPIMKMTFFVKMSFLINS